MTFHLAATGSTPVVTKVPSRPIGTTTVFPGISLDVFELKRVAPQVVLAVFSVQADSSLDPSKSADANILVNENLSANGGGSNGTVSGVSLVDTAALKQYLPYMVRPDDDTTCLCTVLSVALDPGSVWYFSALITAPPPDVTRVTFQTPIGTIPDLPLSS